MRYHSTASMLEKSRILTTPKLRDYVDQRVTECKLTQPLWKAICYYSVALRVWMSSHPAMPHVGVRATGTPVHTPEESPRKCQQQGSLHQQKTGKNSNVLSGEWIHGWWRVHTEEGSAAMKMTDSSQVQQRNLLDSKDSQSRGGRSH